MVLLGSGLSRHLLRARQLVLFGMANAVTIAVVLQQPAPAQNLEAVTNLASAITVRIEGATQGSGVIVDQEDDLYSVLTAWHVIASNNKGEEVDLFFQDGRSVQLNVANFKQIPSTESTANTR